jgi:hypothetical protein
MGGSSQSCIIPQAQITPKVVNNWLHSVIVPSLNRFLCFSLYLFTIVSGILEHTRAIPSRKT